MLRFCTYTKICNLLGGMIMRKEYQAVCLQKGLLDSIDKIIDGKGFASRAEFVRYCIFKELDRRNKLKVSQ